MIVCPNCNHQNPDGPASARLATRLYLLPQVARTAVQQFRQMQHFAVSVALTCVRVP